MPRCSHLGLQAAHHSVPFLLMLRYHLQCCSIIPKTCCDAWESDSYAAIISVSGDSNTGALRRRFARMGPVGCPSLCAPSDRAVAPFPLLLDSPAAPSTACMSNTAVSMHMPDPERMPNTCGQSFASLFRQAHQRNTNWTSRTSVLQCILSYMS